MTTPVIKLAFPGKNGKKIPVELSLASARKLISELLRTAAARPQAPALQDYFLNDPNPIPATAFAITAIPDQPQSARLSIAAGEIDLQFSVPLDALFGALKALEAHTEPDPTSSPRLN